MHITTTNQTFTALVPKSKYKGPILNLTVKDKEKIAKLVSQKSEILFEIDILEKLLAKKKTLIESSGILNKIGNLETHLQKLDDAIKNIKIARLEEQKKEASKIDLMM